MGRRDQKTDADKPVAAPHIPVLSAEVVDALQPVAGGVYVDGTFGAGGYSRKILEAADCTVLALDRDPAVRPVADALQARYPTRFKFMQARFAELEARVCDAGLSQVDGVALDVGVSSMQLDQPGRGFSFQADGPLDMRMGDTGPSAADAVNRLSEQVLADIIYYYGEERRARQIAARIVARRAEQPLTRTAELAALVAEIVRGAGRKHPATRTFQALRIFVNDELRELYHALCAAERVLRPEGRLAVVSFHSLEDRLVKEFLVQRAGAQGAGSRHLPPVESDLPAPSFALLWRGAKKPGAEEAAANPRARSARLRAAARTAAPAWPEIRQQSRRPMPDPVADLLEEVG